MGDQLPSDRLYHLFLKTDYEQETAMQETKESGKLPKEWEKAQQRFGGLQKSAVHCDNLPG